MPTDNRPLSFQTRIYTRFTPILIHVIPAQAGIQTHFLATEGTEDTEIRDVVSCRRPG